ncbi:MAG: energy-coupled thiamine transporter ThiT [Oscillospiraceae bacterium]|nr:energy-coupled thiamine transporter ThiT [Oscillospiraceae bacterium]
MKNQKTLVLVECGILLALAAVLCMFTIFKMPMGGSVTPMSMLPIVLVSIRYGVKVGLPVAFLFSLIEFAMARGEMFAWGLTTPAIIGTITLDYILAFTLLGFAGVFRHKGLPGWIAGISLALCLRFVAHFISGIIIFSQWTPEGWNAVLYSLAYNATYMLPELAFTLTGAVILLKAPHVRKVFMPV